MRVKKFIMFPRSDVVTLGAARAVVLLYCCCTTIILLILLFCNRGINKTTIITGVSVYTYAYIAKVSRKSHSPTYMVHSWPVPV